LAVLLAVALGMFLVILSSGKAEAATCAGASPSNNGAYLITGTNCGVLSGTHKCVDFGNSGGVHAIECVQLDAVIDPSDSAYNEVRAQGVFYCQNNSTGGYSTCAGINAEPELAEGSGPAVTPYFYVCGAYGGSGCPSAAKETASTAWGYSSSTVGNCQVFWGVDQSPTIIKLPNGTVETYSHNLETGHVEVCGNIV
jgi:hypothetical protein